MWILDINGKKVNIHAIIDSGNLLKDPITGASVIVVERAKLEEIIEKEILDNLQNILAGNYKGLDKEEYISKFRLIPFSSLGKQNGMLLGIRPDYIVIVNEENEKKIENVIIGIYNKSLTKRGEYRGLIGVELL